jgi:hypothetical protein
MRPMPVGQCRGRDEEPCVARIKLSPAFAQPPPLDIRMRILSRCRNRAWVVVCQKCGDVSRSARVNAQQHPNRARWDLLRADQNQSSCTRRLHDRRLTPVDEKHPGGRCVLSGQPPRRIVSAMLHPIDVCAGQGQLGEKLITHKDDPTVDSYGLLSRINRRGGAGPPYGRARIVLTLAALR